jgi:hypothetical protein
MIKNKNTILVTVHNLKEENYAPPLELQRTLRSIGAIAEIVTPYNDLSRDYRLKITFWNFITRLSKIYCFSFLIPILFFLKGLEIYRQIKVHWTDFDRILVYDRISGFAARKASKGQIPIILLNHYSGDPYMAYLYKYGLKKHRMGYILMQKILIAMFNQPIYKLLSTS